MFVVLAELLEKSKGSGLVERKRRKEVRKERSQG